MSATGSGIAALPRQSEAVHRHTQVPALRATASPLRGRRGGMPERAGQSHRVEGAWECAPTRCVRGGGNKHHADAPACFKNPQARRLRASEPSGSRPSSPRERGRPAAWAIAHSPCLQVAGGQRRRSRQPADGGKRRAPRWRNAAAPAVDACPPDPGPPPQPGAVGQAALRAAQCPIRQPRAAATGRHTPGACLPDGHGARYATLCHERAAPPGRAAGRNPNQGPCRCPPCGNAALESATARDDTRNHWGRLAMGTVRLQPTVRERRPPRSLPHGRATRPGQAAAGGGSRAGRPTGTAAACAASPSVAATRTGHRVPPRPTSVHVAGVKPAARA